MRAARHGERTVEADLVLTRPDGTEVQARGSATPVVAEDGTRLGAVLTLRDVTAQRALEREKDEFFANASHDLRTPLSAIKASIGVVLANEPPDTPEPLHRMFVNIDLAADRMVTLVADLLELARLRTGRIQPRIEPCDLCALARQAAHAIEPVAQTRGQRVIVNLPDEPIPILADADRLERVVLNLLSNAHQHGRTGGFIRLDLERRSGEAFLAVHDDGPGIPAADQTRSFERFYRRDTETTRRSQGSGLGLPIARAMVELHGGRIGVTSAPGEGSTFWIALPIQTAAESAEPEEPDLGTTHEDAHEDPGS